ncbi:MAG: hypothetical protein JST59_21075 [Actinobacteria bacterium]|nr:hypothetical protein [Actinomycetota bacterium]
MHLVPGLKSNNSSLRLVGVALVAVLALLLSVAASAGAAVRYAAPAGAGASPCNPTACSLKVAIDGAQDGDEVVVGAGTYAQATTISVAKAITVGGAVGSAPPVIGLKGVQFEVRNAGARIHDLYLTLTEASMARPFVLIAGSGERLVADSAGLGGEGCQVEDGTLSDSLCLEGLSAYGGEPGNHEATIANVTADPILLGASTGAHLDARILNSIAYPAQRPFTSKAGLLIDVSAGGSLTAVIDHSNFNEVETSLSAGTAFTYTGAGQNGNQTTPPQLVDPAGGDFRPLSTSSTIDAGLAEPVIGTTDVLGLPRIQPKCIGGTAIPDIGAYEFQPTEACPGLPSVPSTSPAPVVAPTPIAVGRPLALGKVTLKLDRVHGTGTLTVAVPAAGKLSLSGKGIVATGATAKKAGKVRLPVRAKGRQAKRLARTGKVKLKGTLTERLADGTTLKKSVRVTLRRQLPA